MRAAREQPRVVIAKALALLCLFAVGIAAGATIDRSDRDAERALQIRATTAEQSARTRQGELQEMDAERRSAIAARARAKHALDRLRRVNQRLRRDLYITKTVLRRARARR